MKWLKERDELIAQTEAFVKSVTARRAEVAAKPVQRTAPIEYPSAHVAARPMPPGHPPASPASTSPASTSPASTSPAPASPAPAGPVPASAAPVSAAPKPLPMPTPFPVENLPVEDSVSAQPIELVEPPVASPRAEPPPIKAFARGEVRQEIQNRVAAFQANQHRFQREREAYYNSVLTKARSTGEDFPGSSRS